MECGAKRRIPLLIFETIRYRLKKIGLAAERSLEPEGGV